MSLEPSGEERDCSPMAVVFMQAEKNEVFFLEPAPSTLNGHLGLLTRNG
jgi:hypothetical protein